MAVFILMPLAIHAPIWLGRVDFFSGPASDLIPYFYGLKAFQYQSIQQCGEFPLWNPHLLLGQPAVGNIQHALFYPLNAVFWIFPFFTALWIGQALHMALAGYGAWLLARETGCGSAASLTAGGVFMLNGRILYYINAGWIGYLHAICWLPMVLWACLRLWRSRGFARATWLGALLALSLLSGTPQYAFMAYGLVSVHGAIRLIRERTEGGWRDFVGHLAWAGIVFFVLAAVQVFPSMEQTLLSSRPLPAGASMGFHFSWDLRQWILVLIRPEFLAQDYAWELCGYIGIGGLVLAILGVGSRLRQWDFVLVWGVLPALLSMGPAIPFLDRIVRSTPGLSMLVNPSRYFIFTLVTMAIAAGWGLQALLDGPAAKRGRNVLMLTALGLMLTVVVWIPVVGSDGPDANWRFGAALALSVAFFALFFLRPGRLSLWLLVGWLLADPLLLAPYLLEGHRTETMRPPAGIMAALAADPRQIRVAVIQPERLRRNLISVIEDPVFVIAGIDRVGGYEPMALLRSLRFITRMDGTASPDRVFWGIRPFGFARPELFRLAAVTHLIATEAMDHAGLRLVATDTQNATDFHGGRWRDQRIFLYEITDTLPVAYFISSVGHRPEATVTLSRPTPNRRLLQCSTGSAGTVVITESFHDGWRVRINGKAASARPFMDTFIAVDLPAGEHRIALEFLPASYVTGRRVTGIGLILIVVSVGYGLYRMRRRRGEPAGETGGEVYDNGLSDKG
ncbi:MAG: YfhO family protein [Pseudomonadota bacterium]